MLSRNLTSNSVVDMNIMTAPARAGELVEKGSAAGDTLKRLKASTRGK